MSENPRPHQIVDASVHVVFRTGREVCEFLEPAWRTRGIPDIEMEWYGAPGGEFDAAIASVSEGYPGSDPALVGRHLFEDRGIDIAVLHPMTRGTLPDRRLQTAVAAAHNQMLVERWLEDPVHGHRFRGTLRVSPEDITGALDQIERWADHPRVVQIGIPLQSRETYGKPQFFPLFEAAAERGLPVAVHCEMGTGVGNPPTPSGHTRTYAHYAAFMGLNYLYHLMSLISEGVFEALPDLKVVWADGGADMLTPFMWRMDTFGRPHLEQTPWAPQIPSAYLPDHVRFVQSNFDGAGRGEVAAAWSDMTGKSDLVMFGSSYPHWSMVEPDSVSTELTDEQRDKILWQNADRLYGLGLQPAAVPTG